MDSAGFPRRSFLPSDDEDRQAATPQGLCLASHCAVTACALKNFFIFK